MSRAYSTTIDGLIAGLDPLGDKHVITVTLAYTRDDPYAVTATITAPNEPSVPWTWARDLLRAGLHSAAGMGEVIVGPDDTGLLVIELRSNDGRALVWLEALAVAEFLDRTERIVATGAERMDLDRVTRELLKAER